ncbi:MAG: class I SAM-dependent methyltransferase [Bacteroidales bacterium]|nr:class I SAM-dependent methyltransferase [Bacteroidales bacterium]
MKKLKQILGLAKIYQLYQWMVGANNYTKLFANQYICYQKNEKILDIGCGPADILKYLPKEVDYTGIDMNKDYILNARRKYPDKQFVCADITTNDVAIENELFDTVFFIGVQHHLSDSEMEATLRFAKSKLKKGGRLLALEPVVTTSRGRIEKWFMDNDRGKFIRSADHYQQITTQVITNYAQTILKNTMNIPFTIIIIECQNE